MNIVIPRTIEKAKAALTEVDGLLRAKEWERAAIVYAFTKPGTGGARSTSVNSPRLSVQAFADLKINGLREWHTVAAYRKAWEDAIKDGAIEAKPGVLVALPTRKFPDNPGSPTGTVRSFKAAVKRDPTVIKQVVANDADALEAVAEAVSQHPGLTLRATEKVQARVTPKPKAAKPKYWDQVADEVIHDFETAFLHLHALVENRDQLDEYEMKKVIDSLSANVLNLNQYLTDLKDTYRAAWGEPQVNAKRAVKELA